MNKSQKSKTPIFAALALGAAVLVGQPALPTAEAKTVAKRKPEAKGKPFTETKYRPKKRRQRPVIEVAFVLDTTGSMGGLLEGAKRKIWSIASKISAGQPAPEVRIGLVAYRDVGDDYVTRVYPMTNDLDAVYENLRGFVADGGGDTPEHVGKGLGMAVKQLEWSGRNDVMKMVFVVGDAPPQNYQDKWSYRKWAKRASKRGIVVNTVQCGNMPATRNAFQKIASLGTGTYANIDSSGGMIAVRTPYDEELARLNREIAGKSLYAGRADVRRKARRKSETIAAMPAEAAADRLSYLAGEGRRTGGGSLGRASAPKGSIDLLADSSRVDDLEEDELPAELKKVDKKARKAKIAKLAAERKTLEKKVIALNQKRADWLEKNVEEKEDSFDANVMSDIKKKAKRYGIAY